MIIAQQPTYQKVKRPAPGGEGYVIDHFNPAAAAFYLGLFKPLFEALDTLRADLNKQPQSGCAQPPGIRNFFMDSYEVFKANYSTSLISTYRQTYPDDHNRIMSYEKTHPDWKQFNDINLVNIKYEPFDTYAWAPKPVGLLAAPQLFRLVR